MTVFATREGLAGRRTASGYIIEPVASFVALPNVDVLKRFIRVSNPLNGKSTYAQVLDVGPHNTHDAYMLTGARPLAEKGFYTDEQGTLHQGAANRAGIDLGQAVWNALGMLDNGPVDFELLP